MLRNCLGLSVLFHALVIMGPMVLRTSALKPSEPFAIELSFQRQAEPKKQIRGVNRPRIPSAASSPQPQAQQNSASGGALKFHQESYIAAVSRALNEHKKYPALALKQKQQGQVLLQFTVARDGSILNSKIIEGSSHPLLNASTEKILKSLSKLPPFPSEVREERWIFTVPVAYKL